MSARPLIPLAALLLALATATPAAADGRVADLTLHAGDVPRRLVGYGIVTGLDGTGDRSFGRATAATMTVRSGPTRASAMAARTIAGCGFEG